MPLIRGDFALSPDDGNWIVIIYLMLGVALLPLSPWAGRLSAIPLHAHLNPGSLLTGLVTEQSYALAFADAAVITGVIAVIALPLALFLRRRPSSAANER